MCLICPEAMRTDSPVRSRNALLHINDPNQQGEREGGGKERRERERERERREREGKRKRETTKREDKRAPFPNTHSQTNYARKHSEGRPASEI